MQRPRTGTSGQTAAENDGVVNVAAGSGDGGANGWAAVSTSQPNDGTVGDGGQRSMSQAERTLRGLLSIGDVDDELDVLDSDCNSSPAGTQEQPDNGQLRRPEPPIGTDRIYGHGTKMWKQMGYASAAEWMAAGAVQLQKSGKQAGKEPAGKEPVQKRARKRRRGLEMSRRVLSSNREPGAAQGDVPPALAKPVEAFCKWSNRKKGERKRDMETKEYVAPGWDQFANAHCFAAHCLLAALEETQYITLAVMLAWCAVTREHVRAQWEEGLRETQPLPRMNHTQRRNMGRQALQVLLRGEAKSVQRVRYANAKIKSIRQLQSICLQDFVHLWVTDGAATAADDQHKRIEMSVTCPTSAEGVHADHDARMKTLQSSEVVRVIGTHSAEQVWLMRHTERVRGLNGLVQLLFKARGLAGVYSLRWLADNNHRVCISSVVEKLTGMDWPKWPKLFCGVKVKPGPWIKYHPLRGPDNSREWDLLPGWSFGAAQVRAVLYPWGHDLQGFDNMISAGYHVVKCWKHAGWDLMNPLEHEERLQAGVPCVARSGVGPSIYYPPYTSLEPVSASANTRKKAEAKAKAAERRLAKARLEAEHASAALEAAQVELADVRASVPPVAARQGWQEETWFVRATFTDTGTLYAACTRGLLPWIWMRDPAADSPQYISTLGLPVQAPHD